MTPEREIKLYETVEQENAQGKGLTVAKLLLAKHIIETMHEEDEDDA